MPWGEGRVREGLVPVVAVEREHLVVDVGHEEVLPPVPVHVRRVHTHPGARLPVGAVAHFRDESDLVEAPAAAVREEEVLDGVVRHEEVQPAVVVHVGRHHTQRLAEGARDVGPLRDLGERAVAVVVEEQARGGLEHAGMQ